MLSDVNSGKDQTNDAPLYKPGTEYPVVRNDAVLLDEREIWNRNVVRLSSIVSNAKRRLWYSERWLMKLQAANICQLCNSSNARFRIAISDVDI